MSMNQQWILVPTQITEDMEVAFKEAWYSERRCVEDDMQDAYLALLNAAPSPKESEIQQWLDEHHGIAPLEVGAKMSMAERYKKSQEKQAEHKQGDA